MTWPQPKLGVLQAVGSLAARILRHLQLRGQAEPKRIRREKVRQLLRDYPNRFPASTRSIGSWLSKNPTRAYTTSEPVPGWRLVDSPENDSIDALDAGIELLKAADPEAYRALRTIYLDPEAGDCDYQFYSKRLGSFHPLLKAERRAITFLTDYLAPMKLHVSFTGQLPQKRKRKPSYKDQYPAMAQAVAELQSEGVRPTRAMEKVSTQFGVSLDTVKRACGKRKT